MPSVNVSSSVDTFLRSASQSTMRTNLGIALTQSGSAALSQSGNFTVSLVGTANVTITFPGVTGTLATLAGTETFTNKTLTSAALTTPTIGSAGATFSGSTSGSTVLKAAAVASGTMTLPTGTDTLVSLNATQTLTNKSFTAPSLGSASATAINGVVLGGANSPNLSIHGSWSLGTGGVGGVTFASGGAATLTLPAGTVTLYGTGSNTITSTQLHTSITDPTGSGSLVFATSPTLVTPVLGTATGTALTLSGALTSDTGAFQGLSVDVLASITGIEAGSLTLTEGGTVSQATSKSTGVTLDTVTGAITMNAANLNDATNVRFTVTCNLVPTAANIIVNHVSGGTAGAYQVSACNFVAGVSFDVVLRNVSGGALAESPVIQFTIIGASTT